MNLRDFRTFLILFVTLFFVASFALWNYSEEKPPAYVLKVTIPKAYDPHFTDEELYEFIADGNAVPVDEFNRRGLSAPNVCGFLLVSLEKNGDLKINQDVSGSLETPAILTARLREIFKNREETGVFEENSDRVVKTVIVKAPLSAKYGSLVEVVDAVRQSGADPIVLRIDDLPR